MEDAKSKIKLLNYLIIKIKIIFNIIKLNYIPFQVIEIFSRTPCI
jgi:hypothetical protein